MRPWTSDRTARRSGSNCKQVKESGLLKHPDSVTAASNAGCKGALTLYEVHISVGRLQSLWVGNRGCGSPLSPCLRRNGVGCIRGYGRKRKE